MGYDADKGTKGRKRFFLVDNPRQSIDALAVDNELLDQLQTVFVDGGFGRRFRQHLAQRGL